MTRAIWQCSYEERAERYWQRRHPLAAEFLRLMARKQSNLSVAVDLTRKQDVLRLAEQVGPYICLLKTHVDVVEDFDEDLVTQLLALSRKHDFLIFEDRKFADIGNTVQHQYAHGIYHISQWAHITNAHPIPGDGIVRGLKEIGLAAPNVEARNEAWKNGPCLNLPRGLLLLAEMSSKGSLAVGEYTQKTVEMARQHPDFVIGFVAGRRLTLPAADVAANDDGDVEAMDFLTMSPGVQIASAGDALGQQYRTPEQVIAEDRSDVIIVGRGIYADKDPAKQAQLYRDLGWKAYLQRISSTSSSFK